MIKNKQDKILLWIITGIFALSMLILGSLVISDAHFIGTTKQGTSFSVIGLAAQAMGGIQIALGMMMLTINMPNKKIAMRWLISWIFVLFCCLFLAIYSK